MKHPLYINYKKIFNEYGVDTPLRLAHFLAQADHESGLKPKQENLNYSVDALLKLFGRHRISVTDAQKFGRSGTRPANQKEIANRIYGGEFGKKNLGNTQLNDGWNYRGRGIFQITGRGNYTALSKDTGGDYINNPDWLLREADSLIAALWFWQRNKVNIYADKDDVLSVSKIINIGNATSKATPNGLDDRKKKLANYKKIV